MPAIGAIVGALVGATVGGFLRDWWVENYRKPILNMVGRDFVPVGDYRYHRIMVKNGGKRAAKNCIGKLTLNVTKDDIADASRGDFEAIMDKSIFCEIKEMSLCWSRIGNPESITINRDDTQTLEVYRVSKSMLDIPTEQGWSPFRVRIKSNREHLGQILVTSENAQPMLIKFKLVPENGDVKFDIRAE